MTLKEIKFRGKTLDGEKIVTGGLAHDETGTAIFEPRIEKFYYVDPESVRKMICRDIDGREVYEGDEVILKSAVAEYISNTLVDDLRSIIELRFSDED